MASDQGVKLVFVDSFMLVLPDEDMTFPSRNAELEDNLRHLKEIAMETGTAIVVLMWVRRPIRKNYSGPVLVDLDPYCPSAEDYADKIILLHRPEMFSFNPAYEKEEPLHLRVVMNRNGVTGTVALLFNRERDRLEEYGGDPSWT